MEVDLYHIIGDDHMSDALLAHLPSERLLVQADLFDASWGDLLVEGCVPG